MYKAFVYIFCFFSILNYSFAFDAFDAFVAKSKFKNSNSSYPQKAQCELQESEKCFNIGLCENMDERRCKIGRVIDLTRPNFRIVEDSPVKIDCNNFTDCSSKAMDPNGDSNFDDNVCLPDESNPKWDLLVNWPAVTGVTGPWFIWCEKPDGTHKQKDAVVPDAAGNTQANNDDEARDNDLNIRTTKQESRLLFLMACAKKTTFTKVESDNCIIAISKELVRKKLLKSEL